MKITILIIGLAIILVSLFADGISTGVEMSLFIVGGGMVVLTMLELILGFISWIKDITFRIQVGKFGL